MKDASTSDVTALLQGCSDGDASAREQLLRLLYDDLRRLATGHMKREGPGHTLQPTALVHEIWFKVAEAKSPPVWPSRSHFFGWASKAMANFLCDHARHKKAQKSGGGRDRLPLDQCDAGEELDSELRMVEIRDAIDELAKIDETRATILRLSHFSDLSSTEIASALGLSQGRVERTLKAARAWLWSELER